MAANPFERLGVPKSLSDLEALIQDPHPELQFRRNGATPLHRLETLYQRRRQQVRDLQRRGYEQVRERAVERTNADAATLERIVEEVASLLAEMRHGGVVPAEVRQFVAGSMRSMQDVQRDLGLSEQDAEAATAMIDSDPTDWEQERIERFPHLANSLPRISEAWLLGEDDSDPLAGAAKPDSVGSPDAAATLPGPLRDDDEEES